MSRHDGGPRRAAGFYVEPLGDRLPKQGHRITRAVGRTLSPEGSRKKVVPWKTGFYRIARGAGVLVLLVSIDQESKLIRIGPSFEPSGDYDADMEEKIKPFYTEYVDRYPERFGI